MKNKEYLQLGSSFFSPRGFWRVLAAMACILGVMLGSFDAVSQSNVRNTKHNLSKNGSAGAKASTEDGVCVFCHTPHGAAATALAPLWNRTFSSLSYTRYTSASLDANNITDGFINQPAGTSIVCLSCHDGSVALGNVLVSGGKTGASATIAMSSTYIPGATTNTTGYTRYLGNDLTNDHPISITYNSALVTADKELRAIDSNQQIASDTPGIPLVGIRTKGSSRTQPILPLLPTGGSVANNNVNKLGQVQCVTCHDPHLDKGKYGKFLRLNRLQTTASPTSGTFSQSKDIICLACHDKGGPDGLEWARSAHASDAVATYTYDSAAATLREFPPSTTVWQAACLNCHDTHTVQGARRLLRDGVDTTVTDNSLAKSGGKSAIEEACYACHTAANPGTGTKTNALTGTSLTAANVGVPDIRTEFNLTNGIRMPIKTSEQGGATATFEKHEITDSDFTETPELLGRNANGNRHVECTDCHNPHRVRRSSRYDSSTFDQRTHKAGGTAAAKGADGNVASGALRGAWGVEPNYGTVTSWPAQNLTFTVKKGIPGAAGADPLTREYQLCMKCHSNYANSDTATGFPDLRAAGNGGTAKGTNGLNKYTNVAAEFAVNADDNLSGLDQGEFSESSSTGGNEDNISPGPDQTGTDPVSSAMLPVCTGAQQNTCELIGRQNHRSWHPVWKPTGRTRDERRMASTGGNFRTPFAANVGYQTMHCSDCHGNSGSWTGGTGPDYTKVQGPHGSSNNFLLKGSWSGSSSGGTTIGSPGVCGNCHNPSESNKYSGLNGANNSGFNAYDYSGGGGHGNAHSGRNCQSCHIALPHGWRNKAFLVNLNCVGKEIGRTSDCEVADTGSHTTRLSAEPYYNNAALRIKDWKPSGNWVDSNCGGGSSVSESWMESTCKDW